jgi:hypothetical protein
MSQRNYQDSSQYVGPPAENPALRWVPAQSRFLTAPAGLVGPQMKPQAEAMVGTSRTFVRLWDLEGEAVAPFNPAAGWQRGQLVRGSQYQFVLTSLGPMFDPSDPRTSHYWRPQV